MTDALKKYAWEGSLVAIIGGVIMVLTLVSHLTARPDAEISAQTGLGRVPSVSTIRPDSAAASRKRVVAAKPSNPLEAVLGPSSIGGQFTVLAANRIAATPTSDKLTLRLRVVSRAMGDFVTPLQYVMLEVFTPGMEPIAPEHPFSHPVPAGNTRDEDIAFMVPASLNLDRAVLRVHFYNEQKDIPLGLLPRGR
jgi:hypothetical protein